MRAYLRRTALLSLVSRFVFIGLLAGVIDTTLASEPVLQTIAQWNVVSRRVVWVDLSTRSDTIVFVTESVTTGRLMLHWASAPRYEPLRSVDLEAVVVDHAMSPDGRFIVLILANRVLRVIDTAETPHGTVRDVALSEIMKSTEISDDDLRDAHVHSVDQTRMIVSIRGTFAPAFLSLVSASDPETVLAQRVVKGLALRVKGTWERLQIASAFSIRAHDREGRALYQFGAHWPIFFETVGTRGWFCSMVNPAATERVWFVGVWDTKTGKVLGRLPLDGVSIAAYPVFSTDGKYLYVLRGDGRLVRWDYSRWHLATEQHGFWQLPDESFPSFMDRKAAIGAAPSGVIVVTSANDVVTLRTLSFSNGDREGSVRNVISCGETSKREPVGRLARIKKWKRRRCLPLNGRTRCRHP